MGNLATGRRFRIWALALTIAATSLAPVAVRAQAVVQLSSDESEDAEDSEDCRAEIEAYEKIDTGGLFALYENEDGDVLMEVKQADLGKDFILAQYVDRGVAPFVGVYSTPQLISFAVDDDELEIIHKDNVGYFKQGDALARTRALTMSDGLLTTLSLSDCRPAGSYFAEIDESALSELAANLFAEIRRGGFPSDGEMKGWRSFSDNINFLSEFRFEGGLAALFDESERRNYTIRVRYILAAKPDRGFVRRESDGRIGYFSVARRNLGDLDLLNREVYMTRWRLEKQDPEAALSKPVKPITFWIENTTPAAFRTAIRRGVLAWNEAFEAAGFIDAIEVYDQPVDADWDAGDISKNVIRWQSALAEVDTLGFAPAMYDPTTGEILGSDIVLNFAGIGGFLTPKKRLIQSFDPPAIPAQTARASRRGQGARRDLAHQTGHQTAPEYAHQYTNQYTDGFAHALPVETGAFAARAPHSDSLAEIEAAALMMAVSRTVSDQAPKRAATDAPSGGGGGAHAQPMDFGAKILAAARRTLTGEAVEKTPVSAEPADAPQSSETAQPAEAAQEDGEASPEDASAALVARMIDEVITELTMHEVGHALGLAHNFKGSRWRSLKEVFDPAVTQGVISASVMDYTPVNLAPLGTPQGDFSNTRIGPYDKWAIEFGYRPQQTAQSRKALLEKAKQPQHAFSRASFLRDPEVLTDDLTSDPMGYARARLELAAAAIAASAKRTDDASTRRTVYLLAELTEVAISAVDVMVAHLLPFPIADETVKSDDAKAAGARAARSRRQIRARQDAAIAMLSDTIFAADGVSANGAGAGSRTAPSSFAPADRMLASVRYYAIGEMMDPVFLRRLDGAGGPDGTLSQSDLLFRLKEAVFGRDLKPLGAPNYARRQLQLSFAINLSALITSSRDPYADSAADGAGGAMTSAAARPVRDAILRDLATPTPWASRDIKAYREELRTILK